MFGGRCRVVIGGVDYHRRNGGMWDGISGMGPSDKVASELLSQDALLLGTMSLGVSR